MLWLQSLPIFTAWLIYIYVMRFRVQSIRERSIGLSRGMRIALMLASSGSAICVLLGGLWMILSQSIFAQEGTLTWLGMVAVGLVGILFLWLEMMALALTLSLAVESRSQGEPQ